MYVVPLSFGQPGKGVVVGLNVVAEADVEEALGEAEEELDTGVTKDVGFVRILGGATTELFVDRVPEMGPLETPVTRGGMTLTVTNVTPDVRVLATVSST